METSSVDISQAEQDVLCVISEGWEDRWGPIGAVRVAMIEGFKGCCGVSCGIERRYGFHVYIDDEIIRIGEKQQAHVWATLREVGFQVASVRGGDAVFVL